VVLAQNPALAGHGVLSQGAGLLVLSQPVQIDRKVVGRGEGVAVALAQDPAATGQGVLGEGAGPFVITQRREVVGEVVGRDEGGGIVLALDRRLRARVSSSRVRAR
jgi:hypothetical protein